MKNKDISMDPFFCELLERKSPFQVKQDNELFNDDDNIPGKSVTIKRKKTNSSEDWYIAVDGTEFLVVKGNRLSSGEKEFLRTIDGIQFLINGIKSGWKSVSEIKRQMKNI